MCPKRIFRAIFLVNLLRVLGTWESGSLSQVLSLPIQQKYEQREHHSPRSHPVEASIQK